MHFDKVTPNLIRNKMQNSTKKSGSTRIIECHDIYE